MNLNQYKTTNKRDQVYMKKIQGICEYHNILFHLIKIIFYCQVNFV